MAEPDSEPEEKRITVSMRVEDLPQVVPGSTKEPCERCEALVWISPATRLEIDDGVYPATIYCAQCALEMNREAASSSSGSG